MCWISIVGTFLSGEFQGRDLKELDTYLIIYIYQQFAFFN